MYNDNYNSQQYSQSAQQPIEAVKPDFNDMLDVLNPAFTKTEKLTGMLSLPFNPILHPIKTVKGVFETYNKLASVPLAIYSGNSEKIRGILAGTEDFSGKDVLAQESPTGEVHGFLKNLEGFGLDIAADPFIGIARLPEESAHVFSSLMHQSVAPGLPQAIGMLGIKDWARRLAGTGAGKEASEVLAKLHSEGRFDEAEAQQKINEYHERNASEAKRQQAELTGDTTPRNSGHIEIPGAADESVEYVRDIEAFAEGNKLLKYETIQNPDLVARQVEVDKAELNDMADTQDMHREMDSQLTYASDSLKPKTAREKRLAKRSAAKSLGFKPEDTHPRWNDIATTQNPVGKEIRILNDRKTIHKGDAIKVYGSMTVKDGVLQTYPFMETDVFKPSQETAENLTEFLASPKGKGIWAEGNIDKTNLLNNSFNYYVDQAEDKSAAIMEVEKIQRQFQDKLLGQLTEEGSGAHSESNEVFHYDMVEQVMQGFKGFNMFKVQEFIKHPDEGVMNMFAAGRPKKILSKLDPIKDMVDAGYLKLAKQEGDKYATKLVAPKAFSLPYKLSDAARINMRFPQENIDTLVETITSNRLMSRLKAVDEPVAEDVIDSYQDFIKLRTSSEARPTQVSRSFMTFDQALNRFFQSGYSDIFTDIDAATSDDEFLYDDIFSEIDAAVTPLREGFNSESLTFAMKHLDSIAPNFAATESELDRVATASFDMHKYAAGEEVKIPYFNSFKAKQAWLKRNAESMVITDIEEPTEETEKEVIKEITEDLPKELDKMDISPEKKDSILQNEYKIFHNYYGDSKIDTYSLNAVTDDLLRKALDTDFEAATINLNAEQLKGFMRVRLTNFGAGQRVDNEFKRFNSILDTYVASVTKNDSEAYLLRKRITKHAIAERMQGSIENISGDNFIHEMVNRNFSLWLDKSKHAQHIDALKGNMAKLNELIGFDFFKLQYKPNNRNFVGMIGNAKALEGDKERWDQLNSFWSENLGKTSHGFEDMIIDNSPKMPRLNAQHLEYSRGLQGVMQKASNELYDIYKLAGLTDQLSTDVDHFFPNASTSFTGLQHEKEMNTFVDDPNITYANFVKRNNDLSGAFSSTASSKSIMGNPLETQVRVTKIPTTAEEVPKTYHKNLFSIDPQTSFNHALTSAFAEHENLRLTREIFLSDRYKISNFADWKVPDSAISDMDIIVPQYTAKGGLVKLNSYAPTPGNMNKFGNKGYLINKSISAESRTLLKYNDASRRSPAFKWMTKNILSPWKRGVLLNWAFPIGNAGDMEFKALSTLKGSEWPEYYRKLASSAKTIQDHDRHLKHWATLRGSQEIGRHVRGVTAWHFVRDINKFLTKGEVQEWMRDVEEANNKSGTPGFMTNLRHKVGDAEYAHSIQNAMMYEYYSALPTATTNQKATWLLEGQVKSVRKDEAFAKWVRQVSESPVGRIMNQVTTDNAVAAKIHNFNEDLENAHRFSSFATRTKMDPGNLIDIINHDPERLSMANEMIKWNDMHFAEMPGNSILATAIWPFLQFPVKNAIWWANMMAKKPWVTGAVNNFKDEMWSDDDSQDGSFWSALGAIPVSGGVMARGIPGLGSMSTFAMGVDDPINMAGNRLSPILRPFLSSENAKYKAWSMEDRTSHDDSILGSLLHGLNPLEGNIQAAFNFLSDPSMVGLAPSVLSQEQQDGDYSQTQSQDYTRSENNDVDNSNSYSSNQYTSTSTSQ